MKVQLAAIALGLLGGNATAQAFEFKGFEIGGTKEAFPARNPWNCVKLGPDREYDQSCSTNNYFQQSYFGATTEMAAYVLDGRVVYILVHPTASKFKEIADALVVRKGPPSKTITANNAEVFGPLTWQRPDAELFYAERGIQGKSWLSLKSTYGDEKLKTRRGEIAARQASAAKKEM